MNEGRLPENFCALFVIVLHDCRGDYLCASNPTAERYQNYQVLVGMRLHRGFHFVLRRFQFFLQRVPLVVFGKVVDATAATKQLFADAERLCEFDDVRPNIFDLLTVLCFHGDKAISNQTAQVKGDLRAITVCHRNWSTILPRPVYLTGFFKRGEKFTRSWNTNQIAPGGFCQLIRGNTPRLCGERSNDASNQRNYA